MKPECLHRLHVLANVARSCIASARHRPRLVDDHEPAAQKTNARHTACIGFELLLDAGRDVVCVGDQSVGDGGGGRRSNQGGVLQFPRQIQIARASLPHHDARSGPIDLRVVLLWGVLGDQVRALYHDLGRREQDVDCTVGIDGEKSNVPRVLRRIR
jgi:hypothetical protein